MSLLNEHFWHATIIGAITFTSFPIVKNFVTDLGPASLLPSVPLACLGPRIAQNASDLLGRTPEVIADNGWVDGRAGTALSRNGVASGLRPRSPL